MGKWGLHGLAKTSFGREGSADQGVRALGRAFQQRPWGQGCPPCWTPSRGGERRGGCGQAPPTGASAIPSMQCLSQGTGAHGRPRRSAAMSPKVSLMPCRSAVLSPSPHMPEEGRDTRQWPPGPAQLRGRLPRGSHSPALTLQGPDCTPQDPASPRVNICGRREVG